MDPVQDRVQICINSETGLPQTFSADYNPNSLSSMITSVVDLVVEYFPVELAASAGMMFVEALVEGIAEGLLESGDDE